jgi:hypothetical protein
MRRVHDFLIYRWHATQSLNEFSRVRLFLPDRKNSRDKVIQFHVEFATSDKNSVLIYIDENEEAARAVAREVAAFTGLELRDDLAAADARRRRRQPQPQS